VVVIDPQWLAEAMAGVVTVDSQFSALKNGGLISGDKMKELLVLKYLLV
jgi:hypothetical protein